MHKHVILILIIGFFGSRAWTATSESADHDDYRRPAQINWPMVGGDWNNTRYSALTRVSTDNVQHLGVAWTSKKFDEGGTSRSPPVIKNGLLFVTAGRYVYALNARTGELVWNFQTVPNASSLPSAGPELMNSTQGVPNGRGVGIGHDLVFVGLRDGRVVALKEKTGEFVWARQTGIDQPKKGQLAAVAPTYGNGVVFTGLSDGDHNHRGRLTALDARTGKIIWEKFTVPAAGEPGSDTWPSFNDTWRFGGGGVWTNPPVDPDLGLAYFTTGNPVPAYAGDWRPGSNLYTCSLLAVDIKSGKMKWFYQLVHHDVFEADLGTPVILYDALINGETHKALAVLRADGYLFQLDRATGKPILPVEERPVPQLASQKTSATQPFPVGGESILMSCDDWKKEAIPKGFELGCMFTPPASPPPSSDPPNVLAPLPLAKGSLMAFSPQTGYFYVQAVSALHWPRRSQDPYFLNWVGATPGLKAYAELAAIDGRTGKIAWKRRTPAGSFVAGNPLATAGGLMFRSPGDGSVEAYDAKTGDVLWAFQTGIIGGGPPASYEIDGEQYLAVSIGPAVWAFKLGGSPSPNPDAVTSTPREVPSGPLVYTEEIETTTLHRSLVEPGARYFIDEFSFNPYRAQVQVGSRVLFVNNGSLRHEIIAVDGSWGTGPLSATQEAWITFNTPGQYTYICKNHPWSYGKVVVTAANARSQTHGTGDRNTTQASSSNFSAQTLRGKELFKRNCSVCHGEDLSGGARAPTLSGSTFTSRWTNSSVMDLFDNIRMTMPPGSPGSLDRRTYLDIAAFLLGANDSSLSGDELKDDPELLKRTKIGLDD